MSLWLFDVEIEVAPAPERVLFSIDVPRSGETVYGDQLAATGWAFGVEDSSEVEVEVEVPGHASTRVTAGQPRDDVAAAHPQFRQAGRSGFALLTNVPHAAHTEAMVSIVVGGERIGVATIRLAGRARERWSGADAPLVSVVIPCYNQGRFLEEAIASVRAQTYPRVELIVVDDGSTDDTAAVAASLGARCIRQKNRGLAAARNRGAAAAVGEYLVFLDADDRLLPHGLEANMDAFAERPDAALVSGWFRYLTSAEEPLSYPLAENEYHELVGLIPPQIPPERDHYKALLEDTYWIVVTSVMYRREVFRAVGGFDDSYLFCEDYELYLRLLRSYPMAAHRVPIFEYRRYPGTMSRDWAQMLEWSLKMLRAQRAWVRRDDALRPAYERRASVLFGWYGEQVAQDLQRAARERDWRAAGRDAWVLARRYPRGLAHAIGAPGPPAIKNRALAWAHPVDRLQEYLRAVRVLARQTRDEVGASRVELSGHLIRLEALASAQLEQLEGFISVKKANYERYNAHGLRLLPFRSIIRPNFWFYSFYSRDRDGLIDHLGKQGIQARPIWKLIYTLEMYKDCTAFDIEAAERYYAKIVNIPCSTNLTNGEADTVAAAIIQYEGLK